MVTSKKLVHNHSHTQARPHIHTSIYRHIFGHAVKNRAKCIVLLRLFDWRLSTVYIRCLKSAQKHFQLTFSPLCLHFWVSMLAGNPPPDLDVGTLQICFMGLALGETFFPEAQALLPTHIVFPPVYTLSSTLQDIFHHIQVTVCFLAPYHKYTRGRERKSALRYHSDRSADPDGLHSRFSWHWYNPKHVEKL